MLTQRLPLSLMQTAWAQDLNPLLAFPPTQGTLRTNITLIAGVNVIDTLLGKKMQGWIITDRNAPGDIYRSADMNDKTLTLTASAPVTINLWLY